MDVTALNHQRQEKDEFFKTNHHSPLTPTQRNAFDHLNYFPPNADFIFEIEVERFENPETIMMGTNTGDTKPFERYGRLFFEVDGERVGLTLYRASYGWFVPFVDPNRGKTTYPAGRYVEPHEVMPDIFYLDFNLAYNPYCAYSEGWVCPVTPAENRLTVAIEAGEKIPDGAWSKA